MIAKFRFVFNWCMDLMLYPINLGGYYITLFSVSLYSLLVWSIYKVIAACMGWDDDE